MGVRGLETGGWGSLAALLSVPLLLCINLIPSNGMGLIYKRCHDWILGDALRFCLFLACTFERCETYSWPFNVKSLISGVMCGINIMWTATHSHAPNFLRHLYLICCMCRGGCAFVFINELFCTFEKVNQDLLWSIECPHSDTNFPITIACAAF